MNWSALRRGLAITQNRRPDDSVASCDRDAVRRNYWQCSINVYVITIYLFVLNTKYFFIIILLLIFYCMLISSSRENVITDTMNANNPMRTGASAPRASPGVRSGVRSGFDQQRPTEEFGRDVVGATCAAATGVCLSRRTCSPRGRRNRWRAHAQKRVARAYRGMGRR